MNYFIVIIIGLLGIWLGYTFAQSKRRGVVSEQSVKKSENKERVIELLRKNGKIKNNDVEALLGVSDSTAERYLNELENEGLIQQHGVIGQNVFYTLK